MKDKRFVGIFLSVLFISVTIIFLAVVIVDPFFHFHFPLKFLSYNLFDEWYQNDGILRHFDYDTIITGSSMCENFKSTEADKIFNAKSVKVCLRGCNAREAADQIKRAFSYNGNIKQVIMGFDLWWLLDDKDNFTYDYYPEYLYNDNYIDDLSYIYNKDVVRATADVLLRTLKREPKGQYGFDSYGSWTDDFAGMTGKEYILGNVYSRSREDYSEYDRPFGQDDRDRLQSNLEQNLFRITDQNPNTTFYVFFPPFSILFFDSIIRGASFEAYTEGMRYAAELILPHPNIKLFTFFDDYDLTCNLDLYRDQYHYIESVNTILLEYLKGEEYILTEENYNERFEEIINFYKSYDYDRIFE